jgi:hypothetical protein
MRKPASGPVGAPLGASVCVICDAPLSEGECARLGVPGCGWKMRKCPASLNVRFAPKADNGHTCWYVRFVP